ncbi:hypothetical protein [uncultured Ilyobacter sp.]|uniref:hypothetical protein n=1 Tax=uncultured Ilyobacter sp. TaxID=544433 RepID=UPI0029F45C79|nr:hypothetical protein [uncultured Ilyobacter sp.]
MGGMTARALGAGTRVKVQEAGPVPEWSSWDDDGHRVSNSVKKRLQQLFFSGDRRVSGQVVYITRESEREKLRRHGRVKVEIRDSAGSSVIITADTTNLRAA